MSQSLSRQYIHLVFATKYRQPLIPEELEPGLHGYMAGILKNMESPALKINSMPDHIHILFRLSKNLALAKVVEIVKKESSKWMKPKGVPNFKWQGGYAGFSVDYRGVDVVTRYIANQKEHHKKASLKEEIELFVKRYEAIEYDERYFWE